MLLLFLELFFGSNMKKRKKKMTVIVTYNNEEESEDDESIQELDDLQFLFSRFLYLDGYLL